MSSNPPVTTTDSGVPARSDEHSLTVGPAGRIVLHDHHLVEQMAQFNRERVPERQPHAKGSGAFGVFETTQDASEFTCAAVFSPGGQAEVLARFSTVAGERGSPDTWRDMNGYSSYTNLWENAHGVKHRVIYHHFVSDQGIECLTQHEADQMAPRAAQQDNPARAYLRARV